MLLLLRIFSILITIQNVASAFLPANSQLRATNIASVDEGLASLFTNTTLAQNSSFVETTDQASNGALRGRPFLQTNLWIKPYNRARPIDSTAFNDLVKVASQRAELLCNDYGRDTPASSRQWTVTKSEVILTLTKVSGTTIPFTYGMWSEVIEQLMLEMPFLKYLESNLWVYSFKERKDEELAAKGYVQLWQSTEEGGEKESLSEEDGSQVS